VLLNEIKPSIFLTGYIRLYRIIDFHFPDTAVIPFKVYPPRPEQCLQFYPKDTETVKYPDSTLTISNKKVTLAGQHTIVNHRYVGKDFFSFQVVFQPGALYRITGISSGELANRYMDAEDIFGSSIRLVNEQLYDAKSHTELITIVEGFLNRLIKKSKKAEHRIDTIGNLMLLPDEQYHLDKFIKEACLCHRQFDRQFKERLGISPKQFLQIVRFDRAFRMKNRQPEKDWLSIALHCGYYDYQHLVKDYKEFTGYTPTQFFEVDSKAPERFFGDAEI
jgi:AraC-like DNA-binding protein